MEYINVELVDAYIKNHQTGLEETFWAFEEVLRIVSTELERGFELTCELIEASPDKLTLSYVAAGPVEDLIRFHKLDAIPLIDQAVRRSAKFRSALSSVWIGEDEAAYTEWQNLLTKFVSK